MFSGLQVSEPERNGATTPDQRGTKRNRMTSCLCFGRNIPGAWSRLIEQGVQPKNVRRDAAGPDPIVHSGRYDLSPSHDGRDVTARLPGIGQRPGGVTQEKEGATKVGVRRRNSDRIGKTFGNRLSSAR